MVSSPACAARKSSGEASTDEWRGPRSTPDPCKPTGPSAIVASNAASLTSPPRSAVECRRATGARGSTERRGPAAAAAAKVDDTGSVAAGATGAPPGIDGSSARAGGATSALESSSFSIRRASSARLSPAHISTVDIGLGSGIAFDGTRTGTSDTSSSSSSAMVSSEASLAVTRVGDLGPAAGAVTAPDGGSAGIRLPVSRVRQRGQCRSRTWRPSCPHTRAGPR